MASKSIKQFIRFKGAFAKEAKQEIPGRDLAEFLAEQLQAKGLAVRSVENDEISFTVNVTSGSIEYPVMVSLSSDDQNYWEISCPRILGTFARLFGKSEDIELKNLTDTLDDILQNENTITAIKWYSDYFDRSDDYVREKTVKVLSIAGKYLYKAYLPLGFFGLVLHVIGRLRYGDRSLIGNLGLTMFLFVPWSYFGLLAANTLILPIINAVAAYRKGERKTWLQWIFTLFFGCAFLLFTGMLTRMLIRIWM